MEHPDHTGESSNPAAPWNYEDIPECPCCLQEMDMEAVQREDTCCSRCSEGPADDNLYSETLVVPDNRGEHDESL